MERPMFIVIFALLVIIYILSIQRDGTSKTPEPQRTTVPHQQDGCIIRTCKGGRYETLPTEQCRLIRSGMQLHGEQRMCLESKGTVLLEDGTVLMF